MPEVFSSAAEDKLCALFYNKKEALPLCTVLVKMGYPQPATDTIVHNSTAASIASEPVK
jgi:hypothetical protein